MVDYRFAKNDPFDSVIQGFGTSQALRAGRLQEKQAEIEAKRAAEAEANQQRIISNLVNNKNRTAEDIFEASIILPESMRKGMLAGFQAMGEEKQRNQISFASQVLSSINAGKPEIAGDLLERRALATENSGNDQEAQAFRDIAKLVENDPESAFLSFATQLATLPGGKDAVAAVLDIREEQRKVQLQPAKVSEKAAALGLTTAQTAKAVAEAKKAEAMIAKTNAEAGKVALEAAEIKMKLAAESSDYAKLGEQGKKLVNDAVDASINSANLAEQYGTLAGEIEQEITSAGSGAAAAEKIKKIFGNQDNISRLRLDFKRMKNSAVLKMLPPGVASDKDIEIAQGAFPEETDNPELIANFLRTMERLQRAEAINNRNRSEWVERVGSLGEAKRDILIGEKAIPSGTSFIDYTTGVIEQLMPTEGVEEEIEEPDIEALLLKYGAGDGNP